MGDIFFCGAFDGEWAPSRVVLFHGRYTAARILLDRKDAPISHRFAEVVARKRIVEIVRNLAERNIDQEKGCQPEVNQQDGFSSFRPILYRQQCKEEPNRQQNEGKVVIRRADCPHIFIRYAAIHAIQRYGKGCSDGKLKRCGYNSEVQEARSIWNNKGQADGGNYSEVE